MNVTAVAEVARATGILMWAGISMMGIAAIGILWCYTSRDGQGEEAVSWR